MLRTRFVTGLTAAVLATLVLGAAPAHAEDVEHVGEHWTWTGPADWSSNENDARLSIQGEQRSRVEQRLNLGVCRSESTYAKRSAAFFKEQRREAKAQGYRLDQVGPVATTDYEQRQRLVLGGTIDGKVVRGVVVSGYREVVQNDVRSCTDYTALRSSVAKHWPARKQQLAAISKSVEYRP